MLHQFQNPTYLPALIMKIQYMYHMEESDIHTRSMQQAKDQAHDMIC